MTSTARTVLPTDLPALVTYDGRVYANEAMTLDRIGTESSPHPLETAFEQWFSFATGRHTWISVKGPTLRGLVSARKRGSKLAWEVDCLIDAAEDDSSVLMGLLDQMTEAAGKSGALRIFLRLPRNSYSERAASRCGFAPYLRERVYQRDVDASSAPSAPEDLRRRLKADLYPIFQLYNAVVPAQTRRFEASTLVEWTAVQERMGRTSQYVLERDGRLAGWLRVAGDGDIGRFDVKGDYDALDPLLDAVIAKLANRERMYVLAPEYDAALRTRLEERGFEPAEEYVAMSRRTVHTVAAPKAVPALIQTTMG